MASPAEIADFHRKIKPETFWQKLCLVVLCFSSVAPAMDLANFGDLLPDWPLPVWVVLSGMVGACVGFTYYPQWRYGFVGFLPGMCAGPSVLLLTYFYVLPRETVYKAEMALVWVAGLTPAALVYYAAMRVIVPATSRSSNQPASFSAHGGTPSAWSPQPLVDCEVVPPTPPAAPLAYVPLPAASPSSSRGLAIVLAIAAAIGTMIVGIALLAWWSLGQPARDPIAVPPVVVPAPLAAAPPVVAEKTVAKDQVAVDLPQAIADLASDKQHVQRAAASRLAEASVDAEKQVEVSLALAGLLGDSDFVLRRTAAEALGAWATPQCVPLLLAALDHEDFVLRRHALKALGNLHDPQAAPPIVSLLTKGGDRTYAAEALIALGPAAEPAVISGLDHTDVFVRREACRVLGAIGTRESLDRLEVAAAENGLVSMAAKQAMKTIRSRLEASPDSTQQR